MKNTKTSKTEKVLQHLQKYGSITSWEAINKYGATRLSAIIFNLRKKNISLKVQARVLPTDTKISLPLQNTYIAEKDK